MIYQRSIRDSMLGYSPTLAVLFLIILVTFGVVPYA